MNILIVGNILKDVYLNLDSSKNKYEIDKNGTKWLDLSFDASSNYFFSRNCSLGGAAVSLEVLEKMGLSAKISGSNLKLLDGELIYTDHTAEVHRYILISDEKVSYLVPSKTKLTDFTPPEQPADYLYIDRSASLNIDSVNKIIAYLDSSENTKLIIYLNDTNILNLKPLLSRANLLVYENNRDISENSYAPELNELDPKIIINISENKLSYLDIMEEFQPSRADLSTHLSIYSIAAATIIGSFLLGYSVEESLKMARANIENARLNSSLDLQNLKELSKEEKTTNDLELIAASLLYPKKGILAADESDKSIEKKFEQLNIKNTYENRRDFRNLLFTTENLEQFISGVILFDETTKQLADNGQTFVDYLTSLRIIPGIKVDQGLELLPSSIETVTKGLDGLEERLKEYFSLGLRFAKWRATFDIILSTSGEILTPTPNAILKNCQNLAIYAKQCQSAGLVPILEPEVLYDGYYDIEKSAKATGDVLDCLFKELEEQNVNLRACILKVNMILSGKQYFKQSTPEEVGQKTAEVLKNHVPENLAGIVFLSGGQTPDQATENLSAIIKNGPFPWPVTFSFARALTDPALKTWSGSSDNLIPAKEAFKNRLEANLEAISDK